MAIEQGFEDEEAQALLGRAIEEYETALRSLEVNVFAAYAKARYVLKLLSAAEAAETEK